MTVRRLQTSYTTLVWSADGSQVTKTRDPVASTRRRFRNELRVNRFLTEHPPPVETPALLDFDAATRSLTFAAVAGGPLGPKYPLTLAMSDVDAIVDLATTVSTFRPQRHWFRRFDSARRLDLARRVGLLDRATTAALIALARRHHRTTRFAHGDLTARNVLRVDDRLVLIDWELAGRYPVDYDVAFLWFSVREVDGARAGIEQRYERAGEPAFALSALLIELWHLQWFIPEAFRAAHLAERDALVARLLDSSQSP